MGARFKLAFRLLRFLLRPPPPLFTAGGSGIGETFGSQTISPLHATYPRVEATKHKKKKNVTWL